MYGNFAREPFSLSIVLLRSKARLCGPFIAILLVIVSATVQAELRMPVCFSDNRVLQRGEPVAVWGEADPGTKATVEFADQKKTAVADSSTH